MVETADAVAQTLTFVPRGSGEERPRPILNAQPTGIVFDEVHISRGRLRRLAQHGLVTIHNGVLSLLGDDRRPLASAPMAEVTAWPLRADLNTAVGLDIQGTTYRAAPGSGSVNGFALPTDLANGHDAAGQLLKAIEENGGKRR
ncbi:hypothetical protein [Streptomyces litchfieldiae]|uniref:Uncharacterized protein n=1 Tax=Streptomyces litchfieldiae TaxID=3075543 RepID=A0ABU2MIU9_9ACTN|nr:hypothetical protein [Streptomyces sp. DSM 44938]MDT0341523.1 hypothetical protein [Streptomyces sp. DSM 44938]